MCICVLVCIDRTPSRQFNAALNFYWQFHALFCNNFRGIVHDDATTTTTTATGQRVANDNGSDFCAAEQEEVRAFLLPLLLLLLAMPVREILLNKFFNDFYYTPVSEAASQRASHYVSHSAGIHMQVYKCVCVCVSVRVCIVSYIAASGGNTTTHTNTAHTRAPRTILPARRGRLGDVREQGTRQRPTRSTELGVLKFVEARQSCLN